MQLNYKPETARRRLRKADPVMADLIKRVGIFKLKTEFDLTPFEALLRAIVYQQLTAASAGAIHARVRELFVGEIRPDELLHMKASRLRKAGLSGAKILAVQDLAARRIDGTVPDLESLLAQDNETIIERLTTVRGVGRWTVEMMLIYRLGRADVLPVADLGIRKGFQLAYGTPELPKAAELCEAGEFWAPYRSVASWYLWRATDSVDWNA